MCKCVNIASAYDRAAIKFRGVEADINFSLEDYEEDLKQVRDETLISSSSSFFLFQINGFKTFNDISDTPIYRLISRIILSVPK